VKSEISKPRIIILGHSGFLGSCLYEHFLRDSNYDVWGFSSSQVDFSLMGDCFRLAKFISDDATVIMAATALVRDKSFSAFKRDVTVMLNLADLISWARIKHFVYISSIAVYGRLSQSVINEDSDFKPDDFYSLAKAFGEGIFRYICLDRHTALTILRPGIIYGQGDVRSPIFRFMNNIRLNRDIEIYGDGSTRIFWVHKMDLYRIIKSVIDNSKYGDYNIVADESGITLLDLAKLMFKICGRRVGIKFKPSEKVPVNLNFNIAKLKICFPEIKFIKLDDGLKDYFIPP